MIVGKQFLFLTHLHVAPIGYLSYIFFMFLEMQSELQNKLALDQVSITQLKQPLTIDFYKKWLSHNYYGSMTYLKDHLSQKEDPTLLDRRFQSVITVTQSYFPVVSRPSIDLPARIALYAQNNDYHYWLKEKLNQAIQILQAKFPTEIFLAYVDSGPILEKDLAYQAAHGWFGKNSCLIHPKKGSLFFIAEILTSLKSPIENQKLETLPDMCGNCTRCMEICPTNAIIEPKVIKADQCISYLTIESKTVPPLELRAQIKDWFFGCDLCQTVCPWNEKVFRVKKIPTTNQTSTQNRLNLNDEEILKLTDFLRMILTSSNKKLQKYFQGTALHRAGGFGLKRNALIVIGNRKILELRTEVQNLLEDVKLKELADWALKEITS